MAQWMDSPQPLERRSRRANGNRRDREANRLTHQHSRSPRSRANGRTSACTPSCSRCRKTLRWWTSILRTTMAYRTISKAAGWLSHLCLWASDVSQSLIPRPGSQGSVGPSTSTALDILWLMQRFFFLVRSSEHDSSLAGLRQVNHGPISVTTTSSHHRRLYPGRELAR